jgi:hypothetical protein
MKKIYLLVPILALLAFVTLTSYSGGSSTNMTGSHGDRSGCSGYSCHGTRDAGVTVIIEMLDSAGNPVYSYKPSKRYLFRMTSINFSTSYLPKYGFEMVVVDGSGTQAGSFNPGTLPSGTMLDSSGMPITPVIYEQNMSLPATTGGGYTNSTYVTTIAWKAPADSIGPITVYGISCVVNGNSDTTGDKWNSGNFTMPSSLGVESTNANANFNVWPNPVGSSLHISSPNLQNGTYRAAVYGLNGMDIIHESFDRAAMGAATINTSSLPPGMYQLVITGEGVRKVVPFVKQ